MNKEEFIQEGFTVVATDNNENKLLRFLKENYPSIIKDNEIDINELKAIAGLLIDEKVNGYGLNFVGRNFARGKYAQKTTKELRLNTQFSKNIDTTQNLVLKGDNLDSLKILKSRLAQMQLEQRAETLADLRAGESASWGAQIRNYVLHPYTLVKDTRTKFETHNARGVLDGDIDGFIEAYLEQQAATE